MPHEGNKWCRNPGTRLELGEWQRDRQDQPGREDASGPTRRKEALVKDRIIGHPRNLYTLVARALSKPWSSAPAESRQQQDSLHRGRKLWLSGILIFCHLVIPGQAESYHHQPFRWLLREPAGDRVIRENITVGAPTFTIKTSDLFSRIERDSLWGTYWCPSSNLRKSYCNYPGQWFCRYWGCETIVTSDRWKPEREDKFLRVRWGPDRCKHPKFASDGLVYEKGTCTHLILEIQNPTSTDWIVGKMWSVFLDNGSKDQGVVIQIIKTKLLKLLKKRQAPQAVGPNPGLNPQTLKSLIHSTTINTSEATPNKAKILTTSDSEISPLWNLLNSTYQIVNSINPKMTTNCWFCYDIKPPFYEAVGIPSEPKLVNEPHPAQCEWNIENNLGITVQHVLGQGRCIGKVPLEERHLCTDEITLEKGLRADWLVPATNTKWICSKTGITSCIFPKEFNGNNEFCIQAMFIPRIIYHPEDYVYNHQYLLTSCRIQEREPITPLTIGSLLAMGAAEAGTGIASLITQNQMFHSLRIAVNEDLDRVKQSISSLGTSLKSLSEVVLRNRRGLDLCFLHQGGMCADLGEECCVYADNTGVVRDTMTKYREGLEKRKREREAQKGGSTTLPLTVLIPMIFGPIALIFALILFTCKRDGTSATALRMYSLSATPTTPPPLPQATSSSTPFLPLTPQTPY